MMAQLFHRLLLTSSSASRCCRGFWGQEMTIPDLHSLGYADLSVRHFHDTRIEEHEIRYSYTWANTKPIGKNSTGNSLDGQLNPARRFTGQAVASQERRYVVRLVPL